MAEGEIK